MTPDPEASTQYARVLVKFRAYINRRSGWFYTKLIDAMLAADSARLERFVHGWPDLTYVVWHYKNVDGWAEEHNL